MKSSRFSVIRCALLAAVFGAALQFPAQAADEKEWTEAELQLPAAPAADALLTFHQTSTIQFQIDPNSLSIAADGTIRYTLVATSAAGARNVSYEGLRCSTYEKKLFAFGRPDGSWSNARRADWTRISQTDANKQHHVLYTEYLCDGNTIAGKVPDMIQRLKGQRYPQKKI